jgi:hypothetical protein
MGQANMNEDAQSDRICPPARNRPKLTEAMRRHLVERRIVEAMDAGEFDNLPGAGQPLHIDEPTAKNPDLWWVLRMLRQANIVPDEVRYRKQIDLMRDRLADCRDEQDVRRLVGQINEIIRKLNVMGTNVIPTTLAPLDEAEAIARWRACRGPESGTGE